MFVKGSISKVCAEKIGPKNILSVWPTISRVIIFNLQVDFVDMYAKILIAVDGSESNKYAVDDGLVLAKSMGSVVTALCVFDVGNFANVAQGYTAVDERAYAEETSKVALEYVRERGKALGVEITPKILVGRPAETIINESKNHDLVVCGTLGRTGLSRALMGSVAEKVARHSYCPVLVCRKSQE